MKLYNYLVVVIYNYYADIKMAYTKRVESGAISLEWSLVGGVLIAIAVYVSSQIFNLGEDAKTKIPSSLD